MRALEAVVRSWFGKEASHLEQLEHMMIGRGMAIDGPFGAKPLLYADYAASGRAVGPLEEYVLREVLPFYANPHTQASHCGSIINQLRSQARRAIARCCGASDEHQVIFTGSGATAGINKLAQLLVREHDSEERPLVLLGPYEHHSNILPWRESAAAVLELDEGDEGGPDLRQLEAILKGERGGRRIIGAFSAASNVTGIVTDVSRVSKLLKKHDAFSIWDYAGGAPYLPIRAAEDEIDALVISPHKFIGGPGSSGILIAKPSMFASSKPSSPGGGTVSFVSPWSHHYFESLVAREEAGTPNAIGDIRAALALLLKAHIGHETIDAREQRFYQKALKAWRGHDRIELLGRPGAKRLPIFSFRIRDGKGGLVHHQLVARLLSDVHGVQARGGCACAGPYAHRLLGLDRKVSECLQSRIEEGHELEKPGWTRVNFSYAMSDQEAETLIHAVIDVAERAPELVQDYECDMAEARFSHRAGPAASALRRRSG